MWNIPSLDGSFSWCLWEVLCIFCLSRPGYGNSIQVGLGSLSQVAPPWLTTEQRVLCLSAKSKVGSISKMFFEYAIWCLLNVMNIFNTNHERKTVKMTFVYYGCLSYKISSFVCDGCLKDVQRDFVSTRNTVDMGFHHHNRWFKTDFIRFCCLLRRAMNARDTVGN